MIFHKYIVIGSGKSGLDASLLLAQRGLDVLLIEENDLGGSYLFSNDLPKEFLSEQAAMIHSLRRRLPLQIQKSLTIDLESIITAKIKHRFNKIKDQIKRFKNLAFIKGQASFASKNIIEISTGEDEKTLVAFEYCLICTGLSKMQIPSIKGITQIPFLYQHNTFYADNIPKSLAIIGASEHNFEVADIYASLGTKVSIFEKRLPEDILTLHDTTTINYMLQNLLKKGVEFYFGAEVMEVKNTGSGTITLQDQENNEYYFDNLYIHVQEFFKNSLNLEKAEVKYSNNGIYTSGSAQTNQKNIFAIGKCANSFGQVNYSSQLLQFSEKQQAISTNDELNKNRMLIVTNSSQKLNDLAVIDFSISKISLEKPISTVGISYKEAVNRFGSYAKFMILINDDLDGFIKIIYNDQTNVVFGICLTGQACEKNYHFAVDAIHKCYNIQEIRSMLICLGFHT